MFELKKYEGSATVEQVGTVGGLTPKGSNIRFLKSNFLNKEKRVVVHVNDGKGNSLNVACTKNLSDTVRRVREAGKEKKDILAWITTLPVIKNEQGMFISMPQDTSEGYSVDALKKQSATIDEDAFIHELAF